MYTPEAFRAHDLPRLHDLLEAESFALLTCADDLAGAPPLATHLPLMLERNAGPLGALWGHVAKANPHAERLFDRPQLAIFSGPHAYISPTWYAEPGTVPTWNYIAVHALGQPEPLDPPQTMELLTRLTAYYEQSLNPPWTFDPQAPFALRLAELIVAFRMPIRSLEGKWKLNQNQSPARRERVIAALEQQGRPQERAVAEQMRRQR